MVHPVLFVFESHTKRETQKQTKLDETPRKTGQHQTHSRNTPSTTNLEEEGIADAPGNDGNASMPEQVKRPNPWRKMMMMTVVCLY